MKSYLIDRLETFKEKYLNHDFYIMCTHSNYHGDVSFPIGTVTDVFIGSMDTIKLKWEPKSELMRDNKDYYEFSEFESFRLFNTRKEAKEYYHAYI